MCRPAEGTEPGTTELELHFGSLEIVGEPRGDRENFDRQPVLLEPRCPEDLGGVQFGCHQRLESPLRLRWLAVAGAKAYQLELTGSARRFDRITLEASSSLCSESEPFAGRRTCIWEWPLAKWPLRSDGLYRLEVIAVRDGEWIRSGRTVFRMASDEQARALHGLLNQAGSEPGTASRAAIYLGAGLYQEAARELESVEDSFGRILMSGELYLRLALPELAKPAFDRALNLAQDADERRLAKNGIERATKN
jgi:hypothetical protein